MDFQKELRKNFYPLGYEDELFLKWIHLRQGQGQSLEDYYEQYQDMAIRLDIKDPNDKLILKFVGGLHHNLRHELVMFPLPSLQEAYKLSSNIEARRKVSTVFQGKAKPKAIFIPSTTTSSKAKKKSTFDRTKKCGHCGKVGHEEADCFKLTPREVEGKREESDQCCDYFRGAIPDSCTCQHPRGKHQRERIFTFRVQVKQKILSAILDSGSQQNLISTSTVRELGLEVMDHPDPYELSGRNRESFDRVTQQCTFRFCIMREFVDEITCDVVPMDCTDILFGIPFLHDRKATIIPYQGKCILSLDGQSIVICTTPILRVTSLLVNKAQAQRLVQASQKYVLIMIRGFHESLVGTQSDTVLDVHDEAKGRQVQHILR
eukprot:Gb_35176 [translate_table: standard]